MLARAVIVWFGLLVLAVLNGGVREGLLTPRFGAGTGHVISTVLLGILILAAAWLASPWLRIEQRSQAWTIGVLWLVLTLAFEFGFGRWQGRSWAELFADYDVSKGRIWVVIPIVTALAPLLAGKLRGTIR